MYLVTRAINRRPRSKSSPALHRLRVRQLGYCQGRRCRRRFAHQAQCLPGISPCEAKTLLDPAKRCLNGIHACHQWRSSRSLFLYESCLSLLSQCDGDGKSALFEVELKGRGTRCWRTPAAFRYSAISLCDSPGDHLGQLGWHCVSDLAEQ